MMRNGHMDRYRSGHNGPDSKSGSPHGLVGSNPTLSATKPQFLKESCGFSFFSNNIKFLRFINSLTQIEIRVIIIPNK